MKKVKPGVFVAAILGVSLAVNTNIANAEGELNLYNWTDYTSDEMIAKFEEETGIKVTIDTYDSNETLLAKLKSGATGYDLAIPSQNFVSIMVEEGLLEEVDVSAMENYKYVDERFRNPEWDPEQKYSSPYQMGTTSFAINTETYSGDCSSLKEYFEPNEEASGKLSVFKTPEEIVNLAHLYLGQDFCTENSDDLKALQALLQGQKPHVKTYTSEGMQERMAGGVNSMTAAWNGDAFRSRVDDGTPIKYCFPKEGVVGWFDSIVIPKGAKNIENAKTFINFAMHPENMALVSNFASYANAIPDSAEFLKEEMAGAPELQVPDGVQVKFGRSCGAKYVKAIDKIWTKLLQ